MSTTSAVLPILLTPEFDQAIRKDGERAYPNECCGILYGKDEGGVRRVISLESVENGFEAGEQYHRFSITAKVLMAAEKKAAAAGHLVLGFYHSHPDHPARPSEYDRQHAWPFYSYIIVSIQNAKSAALTSWQLNDATEQFDPQEVSVK